MGHPMLTTDPASIQRRDPDIVRDLRAATPDLSRQTLRAGTAHDLGNLIQIASSSFNLLARDPTVLTSDLLGPVVAAGALALDKAGAMVRQRVAPPQSTQPADPRTDVRNCIQELDVIVGSTWEPGRFSIDLDLEADLPNARCDRQGLQNALLNLVLNARDAMPDGGVISVHVIAIVRAGVPVVQLSVRDRGVGMTPDTMRRAFEPFFTTKGTGLGGVGLPMVRHFVESHGGTVRLESEPAKGTTVTLHLPGIARLAMYDRSSLDKKV
jgi:signal transduction histidine kinase